MHLSYVRILVDRFADCFRFYRDVMGFEVVRGDENNVYAEFKTGGQTLLALVARPVMAVIPGVSAQGNAAAKDRSMLVFEVADVDAEAAAVAKRGGRLLLEPVDRRDWTVRTAHLRDPEGNLIEINSRL